MPKVSVIMGVYNCKDFQLLDKSINSILGQTFTDFEFIICNDGSTNETLSVLKEYEKKDSRIKVLSYEKNKGLNYALNCCLKSATGEFIARQDDDDVSDKNRFEKQIDFLETNPEYSMVGTIADVTDDSGTWGEYLVPEKPQKKDFYWNSPFMHPTMMMKREVISSLGGYRCAKETRRCEDIDLFMRVYAAGYIGYNIQEKLYQYRMVNDPNKKYRPMKYRVDEAIVKYKGYKAMGILAQGIPYVLKPILVGLIPQKILYQIKKRRY
ncbi:glycosyltransferase [Streptococcus alactolyticus]|uniref:glycosyltransferase n=1 Tax=Streptococcus alactolyticus TaxID=29389 RepID=UPI003F9C85B1